MPITCFIRYRIDPFQREAFIVREERTWLEDVAATRNRAPEPRASSLPPRR